MPASEPPGLDRKDRLVHYREQLLSSSMLHVYSSQKALRTRGEPWVLLGSPKEVVPG